MGQGPRIKRAKWIKWSTRANETESLFVTLRLTSYDEIGVIQFRHSLRIILRDDPGKASKCGASRSCLSVR